MNKRIQEFLNDPVARYADGVILFEQIASPIEKQNYLSYFSKNIDPEMLKSVIHPYKNIRFEDAEPTSAIQVPALVPDKRQIDPESLSDEHKAVWDEIKGIRALQSSIHADMSAENNEIKRKELVDELLSLEEKRKALWAIIDGQNEAEQPDILEDPKVRGARLAKRYKQLQQNLSRGRCSDKKRLEYETELAAIKAELDITD